MRSAFVISFAALALGALLSGCVTASDTTDEVAVVLNEKGSDIDDAELYWYQRGSDTTKAIWAKYRVGPDSALLKSIDSDKPLDFWFSSQAFDLLLDSVGMFWRKDLAAEAISVYFRNCTSLYRNRKKIEHNDDLLWWSIACTRAAYITNEKIYLLEAKELYDHLWSTQVDNAIGGGMWWRSDDKSSKNACVNLPAVIVAMNLYGATKDIKYFLQAKSLYRWVCEHLYDSDTGKVYDYVSLEGKATDWDFSCNSGAFIGASLRLYHATGKRFYLSNAKKAADYMLLNMAKRGVMKPCGQGEGGAFNGIAVRYLAELARRSGCEKYREFLLSNANSAWTSRRLSDGVNGPDWTRAPQPGDAIDAPTAVSAGMLYFAASRAYR